MSCSWSRSKPTATTTRLLVQATPHGPTCHLQRASCFPTAPGRLPGRARRADRARASASGPRAATPRSCSKPACAGSRRRSGEEGVETAWRRWSRTTRPCWAKRPTWSITCSCCCARAACRWPMPCAVLARTPPPLSIGQIRILARDVPLSFLPVLSPGPHRQPSPRAAVASVFLDSNGNGTRDAGEAGLPGMRVSDGERIVRHRFQRRLSPGDAIGAVHLPDQAGRIPCRHAQRRTARHLDAMCRHRPGRSFVTAACPPEPASCRDFGLTRDGASPAAPLNVLLIGDPQPKSLVDVDYYRRDIIAPLRDKPRAGLAISLGDIVSDDLSLYPALKAPMRSLGMPWLHVAGNHDLDFDADSDEAFAGELPPRLRPRHLRLGRGRRPDSSCSTTWCTCPDKSPIYIGGLREHQFAFLSAYLAGMPRERLLVLALHIPLFDAAGVGNLPPRRPRAPVRAAARHSRTCWCSAGTPTCSSIFSMTPPPAGSGAKPLHEYNVGAACGAFWSGVKDAAGIPVVDHERRHAEWIRDAAPRVDGAFDLRWFVAARAAKTAQTRPACAEGAAARRLSGLRRVCECLHGRREHACRVPHRRGRMEADANACSGPIRSCWMKTSATIRRMSCADSTDCPRLRHRPICGAACWPPT